MKGRVTAKSLPFDSSYKSKTTKSIPKPRQTSPEQGVSGGFSRKKIEKTTRKEGDSTPTRWKTKTTKSFSQTPDELARSKDVQSHFQGLFSKKNRENDPEEGIQPRRDGKRKRPSLFENRNNTRGDDPGHGDQACVQGSPRGPRRASNRPWAKFRAGEGACPVTRPPCFEANVPCTEGLLKKNFKKPRSVKKRHPPGIDAGGRGRARPRGPRGARRASDPPWTGWKRKRPSLFENRKRPSLFLNTREPNPGHGNQAYVRGGPREARRASNRPWAKFRAGEGACPGHLRLCLGAKVPCIEGLLEKKFQKTAFGQKTTPPRNSSFQGGTPLPRVYIGKLKA